MTVLKLPTSTIPGKRQSHTERTAQEPRSPGLHSVVVSRIKPVNATVKLFQLSIPNRQTLHFLPGKWVDLFIPPFTSKPGGFTITSTPDEAKPPSSRSEDGCIELAIQRSPTNPPAAWLWRDESQILGREIRVRPGGSFVWPPPRSSIDVAAIQHVVFVAGGVGINPLISMLMHLSGLHARQRPPKITFLYGTRMPDRQDSATVDDEVLSGAAEILFLDRLIQAKGIFDSSSTLFSPRLHLTHVESGRALPALPEGFDVLQKRIFKDDLTSALGPSDTERRNTVAYVCGPPAMTDEFVQILAGAEGMDSKRVLCEKWW
ncbi:hypothetical protein MMC25_002818 [Agyrium rufum]|nr:hypothetical protein [Agyrium rufum]